VDRDQTILYMNFLLTSQTNKHPLGALVYDTVTVIDGTTACPLYL